MADYIKNYTKHFKLYDVIKFNRQVDTVKQKGQILTHWYLRIPPEIVVWIYDTFENNFEIDKGFTKYLKESCR